ncbi:MAG: ABC transporter permease [Pseudobdellovibrio sp.]
MKKSFIAFWRRNLAFSELAIVANLEYRFNFVIDAFVQPLITVGIEILLWLAIFKVSENTLLGGFSKESYLAYGVWAPFLGRIAVSWMYESMMVEEVASGSINVILTRPISFYEYYLSQMMGYKFITTVLSLLAPLIVSLIYDLPVIYSRIPLALSLVFYYLFLIHTLSFVISTFAFFMTRVRALTLVKNLTLWLLAGELVPIDLMPEYLSKILLILPFSSGVYIPVAYMTGRVDAHLISQGFLSTSISILIACTIGNWFWKKGLQEYTGTGA